MKMTAVQWYAVETGKLELERAKGYLTFPEMFNKMLEILNKAKAMEKEQIIEAYNNGENRSAELYYNETFKSE